MHLVWWCSYVTSPEWQLLPLQAGSNPPGGVQLAGPVGVSIEVSLDPGT